MMEYFGIFALGILVGILGTLMILRGLRGEFFDEDFDEDEFEALEPIFTDENPDIPEGEDEINLEEIENGNEDE